MEGRYPFGDLPDPGRASNLDEVAGQLRSLKLWAGDPSYETIKDRVNAAWSAEGRPAAELPGKTTVVDCFRPGRRRVNTDLVIALVAALHPDAGYVAQWRQALRVISGETRAAAQVRVLDRLPRHLTGFTGRAAEVELLRAMGRSADGNAICAIEGMAGVGKTQLAINAGHLLHRDRPFDRVLFVNLRGFHDDPAQPPADPAAVLDGFLRLLGMPGQLIPHDLDALQEAFCELMDGCRALVVLDNAADADQVRPLLPTGAGCLTLVTSRRRVVELDRPARFLHLDVFTEQEAIGFLDRAAARLAPGTNPEAAARIVRRCGHLPLALQVVAAHMNGTPGWTLADHADRLDECHAEQRLNSGVETALSVSYQHLPDEQRALFRSLALHPGLDFDAYAAAALADVDLSTASARLSSLCRDHLLHHDGSGRYAFHDLVRVHAANRAGEEDPRRARRAALTRLFDHHLAAAAAAVDVLVPAESDLRPLIEPPATPLPDFADPEAAHAWLDGELPTLVTVAGHTAANGWPQHAIRLSQTLFRYLAGMPVAATLAIHGHAHDAAVATGDLAAQARSLNGLGITYIGQSHPAAAVEHFQRALRLYRQLGDLNGQARSLGNIGLAEQRLGEHLAATEHHRLALELFRQLGDPRGEAMALLNLGVTETMTGDHHAARGYVEAALASFRALGDFGGEATALTDLGIVHGRLGEHDAAVTCLQGAAESFRRIGHRAGEAWAITELGTVLLHRGDLSAAAAHHRQALEINRAIGHREGTASSLNGLGETALRAGDPAGAIAEHTEALGIATRIGEREQQARAHVGLSRAHHANGDQGRADLHRRQALADYSDLGVSAEL